jgi:acetyl esterase/lipase
MDVHHPDAPKGVGVIYVPGSAWQAPLGLGGVGESSGAHLIALVAMLAAPGIPNDRDPVNQQPATLQAVVTRAAPSDLAKMVGSNTIATAVVVTLVNRLPTPMPDDQAVYRAASPITHITASSPPMLLTHGDADDTVPFQQAVDMEAALRKANVAANFSWFQVARTTGTSEPAGNLTRSSPLYSARPSAG